MLTGEGKKQGRASPCCCRLKLWWDCSGAWWLIEMRAAAPLTTSDEGVGTGREGQFWSVQASSVSAQATSVHLPVMVHWLSQQLMSPMERQSSSLQGTRAASTCWLNHGG